MIVSAATPEDFEWMRKRINGATLPQDFRAIKAVDSAGRIRGMVGFEAWTPNAVTMSVAIDTPMAIRALLEPAFEFPFVQASRRLVLASCTSDNRKSLRLMRGLGFKQSHRIRDGWSVGVDVVCFELRRDEWLALKGERRVAA